MGGATFDKTGREMTTMRRARRMAGLLTALSLAVGGCGWVEQWDRDRSHPARAIARGLNPSQVAAVVLEAPGAVDHEGKPITARDSREVRGLLDALRNTTAAPGTDVANRSDHLVFLDANARTLGTLPVDLPTSGLFLGPRWTRALRPIQARCVARLNAAVAPCIEPTTLRVSVGKYVVCDPWQPFDRACRSRRRLLLLKPSEIRAVLDLLKRPNPDLYAFDRSDATAEIYIEGAHPVQVVVCLPVVSSAQGKVVVDKSLGTTPEERDVLALFDSALSQ
jgi:hypothetical protein